VVEAMWSRQAQVDAENHQMEEAATVETKEEAARDRACWFVEMGVASQRCKEEEEESEILLQVADMAGFMVPSRVQRRCYTLV
jgi:hypothetical protein